MPALGPVVRVVTADVRGAIGSSSFGVVVCYAIANAAAWTLGSGRTVAACGFAGCGVLALTLPASSVVAGAGVLAVGACVYGARRWLATS